MSLEEIVDDLPKDCTVGSKRNAKGSKPSWTGHKLHLDVADGSVPISCLIMSASVHDRQVGIPLATMAQQRVAHCYDLMDSAYDTKRIYAHSSALEHVPIIDPNPRNRKAEYGLEQKAQRNAGYTPAERVQYLRRWNGPLDISKTSLGHVMFGCVDIRKWCAPVFAVPVLTVDQLLRMVQ